MAKGQGGEGGYADGEATGVDEEERKHVIKEERRR